MDLVRVRRPVNRILVPTVPEPGVRVQATAEASHHLLNVQRVARGTVLQVSDGRGHRALARLVDVLAGHAVMEVEAWLPTAVAPRRTILLGLPRGPALEEALVLGTEAGASGFLLVQAERTPPGSFRPERLERILRGAVTQCGRPDIPPLDGPMSLSSALARVDTDARCVACVGATPLAPTAEPLTLAIGPEGGWSPAELALFTSGGFSPAGIGPHIERTPTAVAAALARAWQPTE